MATIAEQLATLPVVDSLKHAALPASLTQLPWAGDSGFFSESTGWDPNAFSAEFLGAKAGTRSGVYFNVSKLKGGNAASVLQRNGEFGHISERQFEVWLFADVGATRSGYQLVAFQTGTANEYTFKLRKWVVGVETLLGETTAVAMEGTGSFGLVAFGGKVSAWVKKSEAAKWTLVGAEVPDATFTEGFSGIGGNGSNPRLINFATATLVFGLEEFASPQAGPIPGEEGRHQWNGGVLMGDPYASPRITLDDVNGLQVPPDAEDNRDSAMGRRGEIARKSFGRGKTVAYEGRVQARSLADMRALMSELASQFADLNEGRMLVTPDPSYSAGFARFFRARAVSFDEGAKQLNPNDPWPYQQSFALGLRMSDPRYYDVQELRFITKALVVVGGLAPPFTPPVTLPDPNASAGGVLVTNPGNAPADPIIDIFGPVTNPVLSNVTQGLELAFTGVALDASTFLRINFATRQVLLRGIADFRSKIDWDASDWWNSSAEGLVPGDNLIQLRGDTIVDPANAQITFFPAYFA